MGVHDAVWVAGHYSTGNRCAAGRRPRGTCRGGQVGGSASHGKESGSRLRPRVQAREGRLVAACADAAGPPCHGSAPCPTAGGIKPNVSSFGADQFNLADPQVGWGKGGVGR